jgi:hypothetical protein
MKGMVHGRTLCQIENNYFFLCTHVRLDELRIRTNLASYAWSVSAADGAARRQAGRGGSCVLFMYGTVVSRRSWGKRNLRVERRSI